MKKQIKILIEGSDVATVEELPDRFEITLSQALSKLLTKDRVRLSF